MYSVGFSRSVYLSYKQTFSSVHDLILTARIWRFSKGLQPQQRNYQAARRSYFRFEHKWVRGFKACLRVFACKELAAWGGETNAHADFMLRELTSDLGMTVQLGL